MTDVQRTAAAGEQGLLGYLVVEADSPDGSFAYVAAIVETAHWEAAQVTS